MRSLRQILFEDESVIGIKTPFDYPYLKILGFMLGFINSWPLKEMGKPESKFLAKFFNVFYFIFWFLCWSGSGLYLILHHGEVDFLDLGHLYLVVLMISVDLGRVSTLTLVPKYRRVACDFLTKIHLFYFKDKSEFAMKTHKQVHLISHLFTVLLLCQMMSGLTLFNVTPMYSNYAAGKYSPGGLQNSTYEHSLYFSYPFNSSTNFHGYLVAFFFHWIVSYLSATWFCMIDLFLGIMVFHLWGHFKILNNTLQNFPKSTVKSRMTLENGAVITDEKYSDEEMVQILDMLKDCINYHRTIVTFVDRISDVFGPTLFGYYVFHQTSGCLLLLECAQMTAAALMRYVPLTFIMFQQLIQLSVVFELVGTESEKLKDSVYFVPWENMSPSNRKLVGFFLMNVQNPVHVVALGVANIGVTSMATILKTSMTYFTFLNSI